MASPDLVTRLTRHLKTLEHDSSTKALLEECLAVLNIQWKQFSKEDQSWKNKELLVTDGGMTVYAIWEGVDYDEFRGENVMGFTYGSAEIDPTNFHPTHWIDINDMLPALPSMPLEREEPEMVQFT